MQIVSVFAWDVKVYFLRKIRQFAWNVKVCFLGKIWKIFQNVVYWICHHSCPWWNLQYLRWYLNTGYYIVCKLCVLCIPHVSSAFDDIISHTFKTTPRYDFHVFDESPCVVCLQNYCILLNNDVQANQGLHYLCIHKGQFLALHIINFIALKMFFKASKHCEILIQLFLISSCRFFSWYLISDCLFILNSCSFSLSIYIRAEHEVQ